MRRSTGLLLSACAALAACSDEGASTRDVEQAAIERARAELKLDADIPMEARVWTGRENDGETVVCGTVSGAGDGAQSRPFRFAATLDPIEWLVFEGVHQEMTVSQPDKFAEWAPLCAGAQAA